MEMRSKSMCININTAECSRALGIICAMDIYGGTQKRVSGDLARLRETDQTAEVLHRVKRETGLEKGF